MVAMIETILLLIIIIMLLVHRKLMLDLYMMKVLSIHGKDIIMIMKQMRNMVMVKWKLLGMIRKK